MRVVAIGEHSQFESEPKHQLNAMNFRHFLAAVHLFSTTHLLVWCHGDVDVLDRTILVSTLAPHSLPIGFLSNSEQSFIENSNYRDPDPDSSIIVHTLNISLRIDFYFDNSIKDTTTEPIILYNIRWQTE